MKTVSVCEIISRSFFCLLFATSVLVLHACDGGAVVPPAGNENDNGGGAGGNANDNGDPPTGDGVSFSGDIAPILAADCGGCHSSGGAADLEGIALQLTSDVSFEMLTTLQSVQDPALAFVVPGDPDASLLFTKVNSNNPPVGVRMPRSLPPLSDQEVELIRLWIEQGAQDN